MDFFSKCDQIHKKLPIWSSLLEIYLIKEFIFCKVKLTVKDLTNTVKIINLLNFYRILAAKLNFIFFN